MDRWLSGAGFNDIHRMKHEGGGKMDREGHQGYCGATSIILFHCDGLDSLHEPKTLVIIVKTQTQEESHILPDDGILTHSPPAHLPSTFVTSRCFGFLLRMCLTTRACSWHPSCCVHSNTFLSQETALPDDLPCQGSDRRTEWKRGVY